MSTKTKIGSAIDIRGFCAKLGVDIREKRLSYPVVGASQDGDRYEIVLDSRLQEAQKRVVLASILAACLEGHDRIGCIMTECRDKSLAKKARELLLPKKPFTAEYERLADMGKLRYTAMAVIFNVPLDEVICRAHDLRLA